MKKKKTPRRNNPYHKIFEFLSKNFLHFVYQFREHDVLLVRCNKEKKVCSLLEIKSASYRITSLSVLKG